MREAYVGAVAPVAFVMAVSPPADNALDLTTVSAATFTVQRSTQDSVTWTAAISNQTTTTLTLSHPYKSDGTDLPVPGTYSIYATLTVPGGFVSTIPYTFPVLPI